MISIQKLTEGNITDLYLMILFSCYDLLQWSVLEICYDLHHSNDLH